MRILALLLLALVTGCSGCASVPKAEIARASALRLGFEQGVCSATAVGPYTALTATHCFGQQGGLRTIDGQPVTVLSRVDDGRGHTLIRVTVEFKQYAKRGKVPLATGDRISWTGNPAGEPNVYREGYVSRVRTDGILIDAQVFFGDSGSGVFDSRGHLVGMVSQLAGPSPSFVMAVLLPIRFTEEQWKAAGV